MRKRRLLAALATSALGALLLVGPTGSPGHSNNAATASAARAAHARTVDYTTSSHCTETYGWRGTNTRMCVQLEYVPDGFNDGGYMPRLLQVQYGTPQWLVGYDYPAGIPNFSGCDVNVRMYTHNDGTPQEVVASRAYLCQDMQSAQDAYEYPDGPEESDDLDAYVTPSIGSHTAAYRVPADNPQYREIDVSAYDGSTGYMKLFLPGGVTYCVSIWVVTGTEHDYSRNNPACFTLPAYSS